MGTRSSFFKVILYFSLMLLVMSLIILPFISATSPEFIIIIMAVAINGLTVISAYVYLRVTSKKADK
ncbi:putative penicillin-binding protein [Mahella australiensis 50-1 BON]|uniref:Penicillin-binding protein n=1 Tax=Mahella australiensis (strain DSM 15567 / CIP 107919 / 50-1 BON) TaxID=697281 RepID=F4A2H4_MAHA5|nr:putative penicillin-binding protein [Mahella australiensis 50-1 BON]